MEQKQTTLSTSTNERLQQQIFGIIENATDTATITVGLVFMLQGSDAKTAQELMNTNLEFNEKAVRAIAQKFKDNNLILAARTLHTNGAIDWLKDYLKKNTSAQAQAEGLLWQAVKYGT